MQTNPGLAEAVKRICCIRLTNNDEEKRGDHYRNANGTNVMKRETHAKSREQTSDRSERVKVTGVYSWEKRIRGPRV